MRKSLLDNICLKGILLVAALLLSNSVTASASDADKEQRIAEQTLQTLFVGEPVWLNTKQKKFLTLINNEVVTDNTSVNSAQSAILLIDGSGQGPDTPFLIAPLRELLAESGYPTLSIQMPVLADDAPYKNYESTFPDARQRISAALDYLARQNKKNITIIAHSLGSTMLMDWAAQEGVDGVSSIITLGLGASLKAEYDKNHFAAALKKTNIPFLDAFGSNDFEAVLKNAPARVAAVTATHPKSEQRILQDADHFYAGAEEQLVELMVTWLQSDK